MKKRKLPKDWDWHYARGKAEYRCGRPMPKRPYDEQGKDLPHTELEFARFAGWMVARGKEYMKRIKVEEALRPDPDEPRPQRAMAA